VSRIGGWFWLSRRAGGRDRCCGRLPQDNPRDIQARDHRLQGTLEVV
jgi:hypothetical protein